MPPLRNPKHELFCQRIATSPKNGLSQGQCYEASGFKTNGRSADACAARLLTEANVRNRISELIEPAVKKARVSIESLLDQLETTITDARATKQHSVVIQALTLSAKLVGLLRERVEIGGPGSFAACESPGDLMQALFADMTPVEALAALDDLRSQVEAFASDAATLVPVAKPQEPGTEAERSLAAFRRRR
jgi:hypothetical protein